jgi:ABC-type multidrug transport system ATPase subunit
MSAQKLCYAGPVSEEAPPAPLLSTSDLRLDVDGVPVCDGLEFRTEGARVLVLGASRALFDATLGLSRVVRGQFHVCGMPPAEAVRARVVAGVPLDPPLPPSFRVVEYISWSARLAGNSLRDARSLTDAAVTRTQLGAMVDSRLDRVTGHARRGVVLAAALATGASFLVLDDPLANLPEEVALTFAGVVVNALEGLNFVLFAGAAPRTSPLTMSADEALILSASGLVAQGSPSALGAARGRFVARMHGPLDLLGEALARRGAHLEIQGAHALLDLGAGGVMPHELLRMALEVNVAVVELTPLERVLA